MKANDLIRRGLALLSQLPPIDRDKDTLHAYVLGFIGGPFASGIYLGSWTDFFVPRNRLVSINVDRWPRPVLAASRRSDVVHVESVSTRSARYKTSSKVGGEVTMSLGSLWDKIGVWVGVCFIGALIFTRSATYGTEWAFGRYCMAQTLVAPDGIHHPNGAPIHPFTLEIVRTGFEAEIHLAMFCVFALLASYLVYLLRSIEIKKRRIYEMDVRLAQLYAAHRTPGPPLR